MKNRLYIFALLLLFSCNNQEKQVDKITEKQKQKKSETKKPSNRIEDYILTPPDGWEFQNFDSIAYLIKDNDSATILSSKNLNWGFVHSLYDYINANNILTKRNTTMVTYFDNLKSKYYRHSIQYKDNETQKIYYATPIKLMEGYTELFIYDKLNHNNLSVSAKNLSLEKQNQIIEFFENIKYSPQKIHISGLKQTCNENFQFLSCSYGAERIIDTIYSRDTLKIKYALVTNCGNSFKYDIVPLSDKDSIVLHQTINSPICTKAKILNYKVADYKQEEVIMTVDCLCESIIEIKIAGLKKKNNYKIKIK